jgi:hypothetical protein
MTVKIVPDKIFDLICEYLEDPAVTLVRESTAKEVGLNIDNIDDVDYDLSGDADVWVDLVSSDKHMFIEEAKEQGVIK